MERCIGLGVCEVISYLGKEGLLARITATIQAPRFAGMRAYIHALASKHGCRLEIDVDRGLWFETIYYTVDGDSARSFQAELVRAVTEFTA